MNTSQRQLGTRPGCTSSSDPTTIAATRLAALADRRPDLPDDVEHEIGEVAAPPGDWITT